MEVGHLCVLVLSPSSLLLPPKPALSLAVLFHHVFFHGNYRFLYNFTAFVRVPPGAREQSGRGHLGLPLLAVAAEELPGCPCSP